MSFKAYCRDLAANQTVGRALTKLEYSLPNSPETTDNTITRISATEMAAAATDAARLDGEAPRTVTFPGTAAGTLRLGAVLDGVTQTLQTAAVKMANGDAAGYSEVGPGAIDQTGSTNGLTVSLSTVTSYCTTFGSIGVGAGAGSVPSAMPYVAAAASAPATSAPIESPAASAPATSAPIESPAASAPATSAPIESAAASTASGQPGGPTAINPCDLVTAQEAADLASINLGGPQGGGPSQGEGGARVCTYAIPRPWDILWITVVQAPDASTAQAEWPQLEAQQAQDAYAAEPGGGPAGWSLTLTDVAIPPADKGAAGKASVPWPAANGTVSASSLYAVKGTVFVGISDVVAVCSIVALCGPQRPSAPTTAALQAQMAAVLGRLP